MKKILLFSAAILFAAVTMAQTISSSTIDFRYCFSTSSEEAMTWNCGPFVWNGITCDQSKDYVYHTTNARGCDSTVTLHLTYADKRNNVQINDSMCSGDSYTWVDATKQKSDTTISAIGSYTRHFTNQYSCDSAVTLTLTSKSKCKPAGAKGGLFSISETQAVYFAKGNLQFQASSTTWKFADNQYDVLPDEGANNENSVKIRESSSEWIDRFPYGCSHGYPLNKTWCTTKTISGTSEDFGADGIAGTSGSWRSLITTELGYILYSRTNAANLRTYGQIKLIIEEKVKYIGGLILLPDEWTLPSGIDMQFPSSETKWWKEFNMSNNIYTPDQWDQLEAAGAVFLPLVKTLLWNAEVQSITINTDGWAEYMMGNRDDYYNTEIDALRFIESQAPSDGYVNQYSSCPIRLVSVVDKE